MITRKHLKRTPKEFSRALLVARAKLKEKGWSYRRAAPLLSVHHIHLALVLTGHRESRRLLAAIHALPKAPAK